MATWWRTIKLSVKGVLLHPLRSALTVLGIFIGVASVIWLLAIGEGIGRAAQEQIASLGARNILVRTVKPPADEVGDSGYGLTRKDYVRLLATVPTIDKALPIRILTREFRYRTRSFEGRMVGCTPDYAEVTHLQQDLGRFLTDSDLDKERNHCVLAAETANRLFPSGNPIGEEIMVDEDFYIVVGDGITRPFGGHRRLARRRRLLARHLCPDHDTLGAATAIWTSSLSQANFNATFKKSAKLPCRSKIEIS